MEAKIISIIILLFVITGVYPKITGILHWWVTFSFNQSASIVEGGDQIASVLTLLLIPITLLDSRKNHWDRTDKSNLYKNFLGLTFLKIISLQMAILYLQSGIEKLYKTEEWRNGTAIYYYFNDALFGYPSWLARLFLIKTFTRTFFCYHFNVGSYYI